MTHENPVLSQLASAIDERESVDWTSTESATADESTRQVIRELAVIAAISDVHSSIPLRTDVHAAAGPAEPNRAMLGTWGTFRLLQKVGQGAYGEVYRAWDTRLDREVALKLLAAGVGGHGAQATSIVEEGRLLARVRHPNVVTIHGAEHHDGRIGLWMEFIKGRTLEQVLAKTPKLREAEVVTIGLEICRAVSAVHEAGLLHRDIKAHNVMRSEDGRIVLMDLGAGKKVDDDSLDLAGTPLYLSPEVLRGSPATIRSDIYSLGVLLYRLATGSYPVWGRTVGEVRTAHDRGHYVPVHVARGDISPKLAHLIERAIAQEPARRYETADSLAADLAGTKRHPRPLVALTAGAAALLCLTAITVWRAADGVSEPPLSLSASMRIAPVENLTTSERDDAYARGRELIARRGIPNARRAAELFRHSISEDPRFAPAHAGLAIAYAFMSFPFRGVSYQEAYETMRLSALTAVELDPQLSEAHAAMGWVYAYDHDWENAEKEFQHAIQLNPADLQTYTSYSISTLQPLRRFDDALRVLQEAANRSPQSLDVQREIGEVQLFAGRYEHAVETFRRISEVEPDFPFVQAYLAKALTYTGRADDAIPRLELEQGTPWLAHAYVVTGRRAAAERLATELEPYPYRLTVVLAALGETQRAINALERAAISEPHRIGRLLIEPELRWLHAHPSVIAIRKAFDLPE